MNFALLFPAVLQPLALQGNYRLAAAILFGMLLGLALVKTGLTDRCMVRDALTLREFSLSKTMVLALGVGVLLFVLLRGTGLIQPHTTPCTFWGSLMGGVIAGVGLGIAGLAPSTAVAALGAGRLYSLWVLAGMLLAIPVVQTARGRLGELIQRFSAPMESSLEPPNGLWAFNSPPLWIFGICMSLCLILMLFGTKNSGEK